MTEIPHIPQQPSKPDQVQERPTIALKLKSTFSREKAVQRGITAAVKLYPESGLKEQAETSLMQEQATESGQLFSFDGGSIEVRKSNDLWYSILYNAADKKHYYVGIDGQTVPVDTSPNAGANFGVHSFNSYLIPKEPLIGNSESVQASVRAITDNAVARLQQFAEESFDTPDTSLSLAELQSAGSMSLEQFIALWQRSSGHFVTHITRHGVRDIVGGSHSLGFGNSFDSLKQILGSELILPAGTVRGDASTSTGLLYEQMGATRQEYPIINVAPEKADLSYVGESGNVPFFITPAEVIYGNYAVSTKTGGFDPNQTGGYANLELSPLGQEKGFNIRDAILFLPKSTLVSPETGAQYEIVNGHGLVDEQNVQAVERLIDYEKTHDLRRIEFNQIPWSELGFSDLPDTVKRNLHNNMTQGVKFSTLERLKADQWRDAGYNGTILEYVTRIVDSELPRTDRDYKTIFRAKLQEVTQDESQMRRAFIEEYLAESGAYFKRVPREQAIPAQAYWEKYLGEHPELDIKTVFYDGDPNDAILHFLNEQHIPHQKIARWGERSFLRKNPVGINMPVDASLDIRNFTVHEYGNAMFGFTREQEE